MTSLGIALIGTGFMGKCHAMAWSHVRPVFGFVNFAEGLKIERVIHGMAQSARERTWVEVN